MPSENHNPSTTPVCGTCGGEGNCPDCMVWDMPLTETLADMFTWGETGMDAYAAVEAAILADYPAQPTAPVVEAAQPDDLVARLEDAAAEIRRLRAALAKAETERDHYLRELNKHARNAPWNMATSREEAEAIAERYTLAKADKFNLYAE